MLKLFLKVAVIDGDGRAYHAQIWQECEQSDT
jgi:hypothetical protein